MAEVVSGVASTLLANLAKKSFQEIALACGLNNDVEKLKSSLRIINAYLLDAENKQTEKLGIVEWLKQLRKVFDDAGDILDEIEFEANRNEVVKMYGSISTKVHRFFSYTSNPLAFRIRMAHKIRDMKQNIDGKITEGRQLGIVDQHVNTPTLEHNLPWRETSSSLPLRVCGRFEEKEEIITLLMGQQSEANNVDVISIVGAGGLGKSTLAQMVYHDDRVKNHFNMLMWVCVSDEFDVKKLVQKIANAASTTENRVAENSSLNDMVSLLEQILKGKRFLLVLDDVWNENYSKWDGLKNHLLKAGSDKESKGSKIIVTTRSKEVASIVGNGLSVDVKPLPKDECWELFVKCAFQEKEEDKYPRLKQIGEEMVEKCKGVPLAIVTLGCLLNSKSHDENEWENIRDSEVWKFDQENNHILPSLKLSYNHLPPEVKQCFSYCSCFPKDYEYNVIQLIMFWMAHGLLQPTCEDEDAEDIGRLYIKKLRSASLLQVDDNFRIHFDFKTTMTFKAFKMHDLVHDVAQLTMNESSKTRSIVQEEQQEASTEWTSNKFDYLKVLYLRLQSSSLPDDCFATMKKHLRYLSLRGCSSLEKLPDSICKLQNLQSLDLLDCHSLQELPKNMTNLINLQYLSLMVNSTSLLSMNIGRFQRLKFLRILRCSKLVSVPSAIARLTTLKKLVIFGCNELVDFEDEEKEEKQHVAVHDLNLQLFDICGAPNLKALPNWLERATKLRYLRIWKTSITSLPTGLPMASLKQLHISHCPLSSLPNNIDQTHNLQYLEMFGCTLTLWKKYNKKTGRDRHKIAHIPHCKIEYYD